MKLAVSILLIFVMNDVGYVAIKPTKVEIPYCKLKLEDFRVRTSLDNTVAESATTIGYDFDGFKKVSVYCSFYKDGSYITKEGRTPYILNHEQRHFDITYLYARALVGRLLEMPQLSTKIVEDAYQKILVEKDIMQDKYDEETNHSENKEVQRAWDEKIDKLLQ